MFHIVIFPGAKSPLRSDRHEAEKSGFGTEPSRAVRIKAEARHPLPSAVGWRKGLSYSQETYIATLSAVSILLYFVLRYGARAPAWATLLPLYATLIVGGTPLVLVLVRKLVA